MSAGQGIELDRVRPHLGDVSEGALSEATCRAGTILVWVSRICQSVARPPGRSRVRLLKWAAAPRARVAAGPGRCVCEARCFAASSWMTGREPALLSNDRETFTKSIALLNPYGMHDRNAMRLRPRSRKGRARIDAMVAITRRPRPRGDRMRRSSWTDGGGGRLNGRSRTTPSRAGAFLSNGASCPRCGNTARLSGWGMAGTPLSGCLCTRVGGDE